jgi:hypothetical protein
MKAKGNKGIFACAICGLTALALSYPPCNYSIPTYGGVRCNMLGPEQYGMTYMGNCTYDWCDHVTLCDTDKFQRWSRTRAIFTLYETDLSGNTIFYMGPVIPPDNAMGCCQCNS